MQPKVLAPRLSRRRLLQAAPVLMFAMTACGGLPTVPPPPGTAADTVTATPAATPRPVTEAGPTATAETPEAAWQEFLSLWVRSDYASMYEFLTAEARANTAAEDFATYYQDLAEATGLRQSRLETTSGLISGTSAQFSFRKLLITERFGTIEETQTANLVLENGRWYVAWHPSLVLAGMDYGASLTIDSSDIPRGAIYDRNGKPLASLGTRVIVGVVPGEIDDETILLNLLARVLGEKPEILQERYASAGRPDWFMPVGELSAEQAQEQYAVLSSVPGILMRERPVRAYPEGAVAAHLTGYVGVVTSEELPELQALGYRDDDVVGQAGLEERFEPELAGRRGSRLIIIGPNGEVRGVAAEQPSTPSQALYTTIDLDLQRYTAGLLDGKRGAIIVLDPRDGQVLAMASSPSFDPNAIVGGMTGADWAKLLEDEGRPLVNRATQSELPLGSVFKIVTETAALETGLFETDSSFFCNGTWDGLGSAFIKYCWLRSGHGALNLEQGLTASCDIVFYELGKALQEADREALPHYAELFGFGARTGIVGVPESPGLVPDPAWKEATLGESWFPGDSVNLAIGQGQLLVTPLQVVDMIAAVANDGTMYRPRLVLGLGPQPTAGAFQPEKVGALPLTAEHLASIKLSLRDVAMSPRGTAYYVLGDMAVAVAGKTGTAENPGVAPHAWFVGYAPADEPRIAVVVMLENGGEGSAVAAPLFRQVVEYFLQVSGQ